MVNLLDKEETMYHIEVIKRSRFRWRTFDKSDIKMTSFIVIILCTLLLPVNVVAEQYFSQEPEDITAKLGQEAILKCVVENQEGIKQWTRNGFGLGHLPELPGFPRYSLTDEGYLRINPVAEEDIGSYQCQVSAGATSMPIRSRKAALSVLYPPGVPLILATHNNGKVSVNEGSSAFLECQVDGAKPAATISWSTADQTASPAWIDSKKSRTMKDEETQRFKTISSIQFHVDRSMQNTTVVCTAENVASKTPTSTSVQLDVLTKPKVTLGLNTGTGTVREGDTVVVQCIVDANPPPYGITWFKNNVVMNGENSQRLTLNNIDSSFNNAVVSCEARNSLGAERTGTTMKLLFAPKIIVNPKSVTRKEGTKVSLRVMANSNPPARYLWYKMTSPEQPIGYSDTLELIVSANTIGQYKARAEVDGFPAVETSIATVARLEAPKILRSEEGQRCNKGEDCEIVCSVDTLVLDNLNITWYFKGHNLLEGGKYLMNRRERPGGVDAILRIRDTASIDFGEYACRAENEIGFDYASIMLEETASNILEWLSERITYIACGVGGMVIVLVIMLIVYCCRGRRKKNSNTNSESHLEEGFLNSEKPIIKNNMRGTEPYRNSYLSPELLDRMDTSSIDSRADSLARLVNRPLSNLPPTHAGYYGNAMLNSRIEDDRMSSSSSQSQYPMMPPQENWGRPPLNSGRRRSHSPYTTGSELMEFSANSTMSSVMSKGSRSSRSQPESAQSSGEETPLMNRRGLANDGTYRLSNPSVNNSRYYVGGGSHSDGEEMIKGRRWTRDGASGGGNLSDSDNEGGRSGKSSGYYSDGGTSRSGRSLARMRRVSEENHDNRDDELETLSE